MSGASDTAAAMPALLRREGLDTVEGAFAYGQGEDMTYDLVFYTSGRITEHGWQVEMAIPWTSLRFPDRPEQEWRVDFWRNHPRDVRGQYSWAEYDRDDPCWPVTDISGGGTGDFGTTGEACYRTTMDVAGWNCSNFDGRTVMVNDVTVSCGEVPLPPQHAGYYYFEISAGSYTYAAMSMW